jgi:protein-S-isoprenylcysteine O-methyltransferase Ste14
VSAAGRAAARWLSSTSNRTFVLWPAVIFAAEAALQQGIPWIEIWGLPLLAWGYLQYRLVGNYRLREGRGGPGISVPPERLVGGGPYRYCRNPMYLGHLIFLAGLAFALDSWLAAALFVFHAAWFDRRVREDEARLSALFGDSYREYRARVKRWIPGLL